MTRLAPAFLFAALVAALAFSAWRGPRAAAQDPPAGDVPSASTLPAPPPAAGPPPALAWLKAYGGETLDSLNYLLPSSDGGLLAVGRTESKKGDVERSVRSSHAWILKLDGDGGILFKRALSGSYLDFGELAIETSGGDYLVMGETTSSDGDFKSKPRKAIELDVFLAKLDPSGKTLWVRTYGGKLAETAGGVLEEPDGGYLFIGTAESAGAGKGCFDTPKFQPQLFAVKVDRDGRETSSHCVKLRYGVQNVRLVRAPGGEALFLGTAMDGDEEESYAFAGWLKPDATIFDIWEIPADGPRTAYGAAALRGGGLVGAGCRGRPLGEADGRCSEAWLFGLTPGLDLEWDRFWPHERASAFQGIARSKGGFLAAGYVQNPLSGKDVSDAYVVMADSEGSPLWEAVLSGSGRDNADGAAALPDGGVAVFGKTASFDGDFAGAYREGRPADDYPGDVFVARFAPWNMKGQGVEAAAAAPE
ncbi:MAG: hypothetical protein LBQ12_10240 [Deltaproteobacteria bacterium]|jgi:hypothetical protein|nr:hypothetical protein [Deltaproteobacteria bacterium]